MPHANARLNVRGRGFCSLKGCWCSIARLRMSRRSWGCRVSARIAG